LLVLNSSDRDQGDLDQSSTYSPLTADHEPPKLLSDWKSPSLTARGREFRSPRYVQKASGATDRARKMGSTAKSTEIGKINRISVFEKP
jgi:hypothetical protein